MIMANVKQNIPAVQSTNDCSVVSKCSMISQGYFDDDMLPCFVTKISRRSPLINRGYYIRAKAIEHTFQIFLENVKDPLQVLSLGAGYDCTYFRLSSKNILPLDAVYYEVDFPRVVQNKKSVILQNKKLLNCINEQQNEDLLPSCAFGDARYKLLGADLQDTTALAKLLQENEFRFNKPTLVLSECVTVYMDPQKCEQLLRWVAQEIEAAVFASYEQIDPNDGFGRVMVNHFDSIGSPLKGICTYSTKNKQRERFLSLGWTRCVLMDMNDIYDVVVDQKEKEKIDYLEPFDEFEEWHLKCNHYLMIWAAVGNCVAFINKFCVREQNVDRAINNDHVLPYKYVPNQGNVLRFGHTSWALNQHIFTSGGFGNRGGSHRRLDDVCVFNQLTEVSASVSPNKSSHLDSRMFHTSTVLSSGRVLLIGGRSSPQNASPLLLTLEMAEMPAVDELRQNVDSGQWEFSSQQIECCGVVPCRRWRHSACNVAINGVEHVVIFGGRTTEDKYLNDCYLLNSETLIWKQIPPTSEAPLARHSHSSNSWDQDVIVACGLGQGEIPLSSIHLLNCSEFTWTYMKIDGLLPRYSHTSHIIQNKLILIGGVNKLTDFPPGVAVVDLIEKSSSELKFSLLPVDPPIMLHNHTSVLSEDKDEIIVLGGGGNCFSFGTHFNGGNVKLSVKYLLGNSAAPT